MSSLMAGENLNMQNTYRDPARLGREVAPREPVQTQSGGRPLKKRKRRRPGFGHRRSPMLSHFRRNLLNFEGSYRGALGQCLLDRPIAPKKRAKLTKNRSNPFLAKKGAPRRDPETTSNLIKIWGHARSAAGMLIAFQEPNLNTESKT